MESISVLPEVFYIFCDLLKRFKILSRRLLLIFYLTLDLKLTFEYIHEHVMGMGKPIYSLTMNLIGFTD